MQHVFLSYASADRPTAVQVQRQLHAFYDVFLDAASLHGGARWEREIESAMRRADAVVAIVSPASAASDWVRRELVLAENLGKPVVPLLIEGELPLRLLDHQYVDLRASSRAGMAELFRALRAHAAPVAREGHEADLLLAQAVRARWAGRRSSAEELLRAAIELDGSLAPYAADAWGRLVRADPPALPADSWLMIVERTVPVDAGEDHARPRYRWSLQIEAPERLLRAIDKVTYTLHPTFRPPSQVVRSPQDGFGITCIGWGRFEVGVAVALAGGQEFPIRYMLTFQPHATHRVPWPPGPE